jgi:hypothetical protein
MMTMLRSSSPRLLALGVAAVLAGCATTQMNAEWRDPAFSVGALKRARVLVVCRAPDEALRRVCEDRWSSLLGAHGMVPERSYSIPGFPLVSGETSAEMTAAVRASGVAALASMSLIPGDMGTVTPGPQVGVSGGSGGGHRGGGFSVGGIGISFPIGGATVTRSLGASSSFVDVASGKLVWSGTASTPASSDRLAQVGELTRVTIEALRRAGLI